MTNTTHADLSLLEELHSRRRAVAALLSASAAALADKNSFVLERRAHVALLAAVYEKLLAAGEDVSDHDLAALSQAIADHRRMSLREPEPTEEETRDPAEDWETLSQAVRDVYGVNLHPWKEPQPDAATR